MDEVERVFRQLVDVIADEHPEQLHSPIQASEIYQKLLPYRRFRSSLRFDTNQDYEMALLRLLAGTHGYVSVEPSQAQDELRSEAESVNPNPSVIRDHAAAKVFLNASIVRQILSEREAFAPPAYYEEDEGHPRSEKAEEESFGVGKFELVEVIPKSDDLDADPETTEDVPPLIEESGPPMIESPQEKSSGKLDESPDPEAEERIFDIEEKYACPDDETDDPVPVAQEPAEPEPTTKPQDSLACTSCNKELPPGKNVMFCPFCGTNQTRLNCSQCGGEMEPSWTFCISCGTKPEI